MGSLVGDLSGCVVTSYLTRLHEVGPVDRKGVADGRFGFGCHIESDAAHLTGV